MTTVLDLHEPSAWLRGRLDELRERHREPVIGCTHLEPGQSDPAYPLMATLWDTDHITCYDCRWLFAVDGPENYRCDRCGVIVEEPDVISAAIFAATPLLDVGFGLCPSCTELEVPS